MTLSAFPYPGGKTRITDWIVDKLPAHTIYAEPFGGSAAVLLNKPRSNVEVYNDVDGDIVQFFDVVRGHPDDLKAWARRTPFSEELYNRWVQEYYDGDRPDDPVERAGRWLFLRYTQFGGKVDHVAGFKRDQPRTRRGASNLWRTVDDRIDDIAERLQGVSVQNADFGDVVEKYDGPDTLFYCDPPYLQAERTYRIKGFDHEALASALSTVEGYAMVSYTARPAGYDGWTELTRTHNHEVGRKRKEVTERLLMNFNLADEPMFAGERHQQCRLGGAWR